jgi:hypothetical protein
MPQDTAVRFAARSEEVANVRCINSGLHWCLTTHTLQTTYSATNRLREFHRKLAPKQKHSIPDILYIRPSRNMPTQVDALKAGFAQYVHLFHPKASRY